MSDNQITYTIKGAYGEVLDSGFDRLADAVLRAAGWDGHGSEFKRGEDGRMRLYGGWKHIGNNPYHPKDSEAFYPESDLADDDRAKDQVAREVWARGVLHSKFSLEIVAIEWAGGEISKIGDEGVDDYIKRFCEGLDEDEVPDHQTILEPFK